MQTYTETGQESETPKMEQLSIQVQEQAQKILQNSTKQIQGFANDRSNISCSKKNTVVDQSIQTDKTNFESQITLLEDQLIDEATKNNVVRLQNAKKTKQIKQLNALLNSLKEQFDTDDVSNIPNLYKASLTHIQLLQEQNKSLQLETSQLKSLVKNGASQSNVQNQRDQDDLQSFQCSTMLKSENILLSSKQATELKEEIQDLHNKQQSQQRARTDQEDFKPEKHNQDKSLDLNHILPKTNNINQQKKEQSQVFVHLSTSLKSSTRSNVELSESNEDGINLIHKRKYTDVIEQNRRRQKLLDKQNKAKVHQLRDKKSNKLKRSQSISNINKSITSSSYNDDIQLHIKPIEQKENEVQTSAICNREYYVQTDDLQCTHEDKETSTSRLIIHHDNFTQIDDLTQVLTDELKSQINAPPSEEKTTQTQPLKTEQRETQAKTDLDHKQLQTENLVLNKETQTECCNYSLVEILSKETQYQDPYPCVKQQFSIDQSEQDIEIQQLRSQNIKNAQDLQEQQENKQHNNSEIKIEVQASSCQTNQVENLDSEVINKNTLIKEYSKINMMIKVLQNVNSMFSNTDNLKASNQLILFDDSKNFTENQQLNDTQTLSESVNIQQIMQNITEQIQSLEEQVLKNKQQSAETIAKYNQVSQDKQVLIKQLEEESKTTSLLKNKLTNALEQLNNDNQSYQQVNKQIATSPRTDEGCLFKQQLMKLNQQKITREKVNDIANRLEVDRLKKELEQMRLYQDKYKQLQVENTQLRVQNKAYHQILQKNKH